MLQVGVTGGIGSGKTLVCSILENLGVPVYYADREAKRLMNEHRLLREGIVKLFGREAYGKEGINSAYLGKRVFGERELLGRLNSLVHPVVREDYRRWSGGWKKEPYVVEEAAILFESGANRFMDMTVLVYAPLEIRIRRVMQRDGLNREEIIRRMDHQMDEEEKRMLADTIILNDDTEMLLPQVITLHERIVKSK